MRLRKLKPSGVMFSMYIDPDASDDENDPIVKKRRELEA